jgi:hypothetical protein
MTEITSMDSVSLKHARDLVRSLEPSERAVLAQDLRASLGGPLSARNPTHA